MAGKKTVHGRMTRELLKIKDRLSGMKKGGEFTSEPAATLATEEALEKHLKVTENFLARRIEKLQKDFEATQRRYRELEKSHSELAHAHGELARAYEELRKMFLQLKASCILPEEFQYSPRELTSGIKAFWLGPEGRIMEITPTGTITSWSPTAESLCGYTAAEAKDLSISTLIPRENYDRFCRDIERVNDGNVILNTVFVKKNSEQVKVSLKLSPVKDEQGNTTAVSVDAIALL